MLRSVCSPLQPFGPPTASDRDGNAFLRFAPFLNSAWSYHCARKLACGTPCFIGLTPRCFAHSARASCAPRLRLRGVPCLRTALRFACAVFRHCGRPLGVSSRLQPLRGLRLRTTLRSVCSALQPFGPSPFCKHLHPQFAIVDLHRSQARLQLLLLTGLTSACFAHCARPPCAPQKMPEMTYTPSFLI